MFLLTIFSVIFLVTFFMGVNKFSEEFPLRRFTPPIPDYSVSFDRLQFEQAKLTNS